LYNLLKSGLLFKPAHQVKSNDKVETHTYVT
jgi:hypothetical protein